MPPKPPKGPKFKRQWALKPSIPGLKTTASNPRHNIAMKQAVGINKRFPKRTI